MYKRNGWSRGVWIIDGWLWVHDIYKYRNKSCHDTWKSEISESDPGSYTSVLSRQLLELNTNPANFASSYVSYGMICSHYRNKNSIDALRKLLLSLSWDYFPLHQLYSRMYSSAVTGFQVFLSKNKSNLSLLYFSTEKYLN